MPAKRAIPIQFDVRLHDLGEQVDLPYPVKRALAWWIAAEMIRRHPDDMRVIETHPGGGMYDCLSLYRRYPQDSLVAHMNLVGHITHESWFDDPGGGTRLGVADPRFNWFEVLAAEAAAFTTRTWHIRNAFHDSSGMWSGVNEWVCDIEGPGFEPRNSDHSGEPHYRYWFVLDHEEQAAAVVDVDVGVAWRRERPGAALQLMELYEMHSSKIDRVMAEVFPAVE
jgi:hypothetical protein